MSLAGFRFETVVFKRLARVSHSLHSLYIVFIYVYIKRKTSKGLKHQLASNKSCTLCNTIAHRLPPLHQLRRCRQICSSTHSSNKSLHWKENWSLKWKLKLRQCQLSRAFEKEQCGFASVLRKQSFFVRKSERRLANANLVSTTVFTATLVNLHLQTRETRCELSSLLVCLCVSLVFFVLL